MSHLKVENTSAIGQDPLKPIAIPVKEQVLMQDSLSIAKKRVSGFGLPEPEKVQTSAAHVHLNAPAVTAKIGKIEAARAKDSKESAVEPMSPIPTLPQPHPIQNPGLKDALDNNILLNPPPRGEEFDPSDPIAFEKFVMIIYQFLMEMDQDRAGEAKESLFKNHERREELVKELQKLGVNIRGNEKISFYVGGVQMTTAAAALVLGVACPALLGISIPMAITGSAGLISAVSSAVELFFKNRADKYKAESIVQESQRTLCENDITESTKKFSGNIKEWVELFSELSQFVKTNDEVKKMIIRS